MDLDLFYWKFQIFGCLFIQKFLWQNCFEHSLPKVVKRFSLCWLVVDRMSTLADISCISNVSMIQTTHLNETSSTTQNRRSTGEFETTVESIDLTKSTSDLFLDGCKVMKRFKEGIKMYRRDCFNSRSLLEQILNGWLWLCILLYEKNVVIKIKVIRSKCTCSLCWHH